MGAVVYLRGHEGARHRHRPQDPGLRLQDQGHDTVDANLQLGLPADSREYGIGAQILADLGITTMRLMTNNPAKYGGLEGFGLEIVERVPLQIASNPENEQYLRTKRERMGHLLDGMPKADRVRDVVSRPRAAGARRTPACGSPSSCARFNDHVTLRLLDGARRGLADCKVADADVTVVWVPGAFEIPLAAKAFAESRNRRRRDLPRLRDPRRDRSLRARRRAGRGGHPAGRAGHRRAGRVRRAHDRDLDQALARSFPEPGAHNVGAEAADVAVEMVAVTRPHA